METLMSVGYELMIGAFALAILFVLFGVRAPAERGGGCGSCTGECGGGGCTLDAELSE